MSTSSEQSIFLADDLTGLCINDLMGQGWQNRYRQLIKWGDRLAAKPSIHNPNNLVKGCASNVWLVHRQIDGFHEFAIDADARIIKGLVVLLLLAVQGLSSDAQGCSQEALDRRALDQLFVELELDKHLSGSRSNGFRALLDAVFQAVQG
jgi:sulfur transfer protein SufE